MSSRTRSAMQGTPAQTLRAFTNPGATRMHLTLDGVTILHRPAFHTDGPDAGKMRNGEDAFARRTVPADAVYLSAVPESGWYCYACLRGNGPRAEILAAGYKVPTIVRPTAAGTPAAAPSTPATGKRARKATLRDAYTAIAAGAPADPASAPSADTLAALGAELSKMHADMAALLTRIVALGNTGPAAPTQGECSESAGPAEGKRTGKAPAAATDAALLAAALAAWNANKGKGTKEGNSAAYAPLRKGRAERAERDALWATHKEQRSA